MGCPGVVKTNSTSAVRIGAVTWGTGYNYPDLVGGNFSTTTYGLAADGEDPSALNGANASCSCLCSGILQGGPMPVFQQTVRTSTYTQYQMSMPNDTGGYYPGGSTGIYMRSTSSRLWYFNVGQKARCGKILAGLYQMGVNNSRWTLGGGPCCGYDVPHNWASWYQRLDVTIERALFGVTPQGYWPHYNSTWTGVQNSTHSQGNGAFGSSSTNKWISLCINHVNIGTEDGTQCSSAECLNPMDYGTGIGPSISIPNGHNLVAGCPSTSTVWQTCEDANCTPNGRCMGPPNATQPTGCISANSPLNGGSDLYPKTLDNACFDCTARAIFHPCYASGTDNTPLWNGASNVWESPNGMQQVYSTVPAWSTPSYGGCETMGMGTNYASLSDYSDVSNGYLMDNYMQTLEWDSCCAYLQFGCPNPKYANFLSQTAGAHGIDCAGNPDPADSREWDALNNSWICLNAPWLPNSITYTDDFGVTQTATQPPPGPGVPCVGGGLISNSVANTSGHPMGWAKTDYQSADECCCTDMGCLDDGQGPLSPWSTATGWPINNGPRYTIPWTSLGGAANTPYYPGYESIVGNISPVTINGNSQAASNYCYMCTEDCNGDPVGTNAAGWADCCQYQIPGCLDSSAGPNPDIFGNGSYAVWNYNPLATLDDGSCFENEPILGCMDDGGLGLNVIGLPPYSNYLYAGIPANNFNPIANISNGICTYDYGCADPFAQNYDPCADSNNYTAISAGGPPMCTSTNSTADWVAQAGYTSMQIAWIPDPSLCTYDIPGAGPGCMDPQAINYNPLATTDCNDNIGPPGPPYPADFSCCSYPTEGCTDPNAWNYNIGAMIDDGSCEYVITPFQDEVNFLNGTPVLLCRTPLTKEEALMNVAEPPEIQSEIFIERGKQSVMEPNQRLGEITTMGGLVNYAYGYYKIKKQE